MMTSCCAFSNVVDCTLGKIWNTHGPDANDPEGSGWNGLPGCLLACDREPGRAIRIRVNEPMVRLIAFHNNIWLSELRVSPTLVT